MLFKYTGTSAESNGQQRLDETAFGEDVINWQYYPKSNEPPPLALKIVEVFEAVETTISSADNSKNSNDVLAALRPRLRKHGFSVEAGKLKEQKITIPVLLGRNGRPEKSFDADAHHKDGGFVLEVEAGRAVTNNQFLKDLFQACMMQEVQYLGIAVRNTYSGNRDSDSVEVFFDTLYASRRLTLPLSGILIIGY